MPDHDNLTVARRYAEAYAAFDTAELHAVLAPGLQFRQLNPGGYLELDTAQAYIDATSEFLDAYDNHAASSASAERMGDVVVTVSRMELDRAGSRYLMQHSELVTVTGGKVTAIDSVCTGARPAGEQR
jgi:hypothetical protein